MAPVSSIAIPAGLFLILLSDSASAACASFNEHTCDNGMCISSFDACDGKADCSDGSDETAELCSKISRCSSGGFRCSYGACVDLSSKCNGMRDCADNSDELLPECQNSFSNNQPVHISTCRPNHAPCDSGQCVNEFSFCDGTANCDDGSDETAKRCINFMCPPMAFRCAYGACIERRLTCNGVNDCQDGSDESLDLCPGSYPSGATRPAISTPRTVPTTRRPPTSSRPPSSLCAYPDQPQNGKYVINSEHGGVTLKYTCNSGYALRKPNENDPSLISLCVNGTWTVPDVTCQKLCLPLPTKSLTVKCSYRRREVDCCRPALPGTIAELSCELGHRQPEPKPDFNSVTCLPTGQWDKKPFKCKQGNSGSNPIVIVYKIYLTVKVDELPYYRKILQLLKSSPHLERREEVDEDNRLTSELASLEHFL